MGKTVKITVLVDNEAPENLAKEHGFSAWIETNEYRILFDTGQLGALLTNADTLGIDLNSADKLVFSHGHYDHTGQLPAFLEKNHTAHLYCCPQLRISRYSCKIGTTPRFIGMPEASIQALSSIPTHRIHEISCPHYLTLKTGITGPVPRHTLLEDTGGPFYLDDQRHIHDLIEDDQSMWFETEQGLLILLGCCHAGLVNTVEYIRKISGISKIHAIIGGMHLVNANEERLAYTIDHLKNWHPDLLIPCHCTGQPATNYMLDTIGNTIVKPGHAGFVIEA